jgi:hypothetical protein
MATAHSRFSVIGELLSSAFCKIAATVSRGRGYPKLPALSDNPLPSSIYDGGGLISLPTLIVRVVAQENCVAAKKTRTQGFFRIIRNDFGQNCVVLDVRDNQS